MGRDLREAVIENLKVGNIHVIEHEDGIERFREIEEAPEYWISDRGRVWSTKTSKFLSKELDKDGYELVNLSIHNNRKTFRVHRLVAMAFIPNDRPEATVVDHINRVKDDNHMENLRWTTISENSRNRDIKPIPKPKKVRCVETQQVFSSLSQCEREMGIAVQRISEVCNGIKKSTNGYTFEFVNS